jgi:hypothetical protein
MFDGVAAGGQTWHISQICMRKPKIREVLPRVNPTKMWSGVYHSFSDGVCRNSKMLGLIGKILEAIGFLIPDIFYVYRNCRKMR